MGSLNKNDYDMIISKGDGACLFNSVAQNIHLDETYSKRNKSIVFIFKKFCS